MSLPATKAVWKYSKLTGSGKLLMLALADFAGLDGMAYPGVATLAEMVGTSDRQIKRLLVQAKEAGELAIDYNRGRGNTNVYRILLPIKGDTDVTFSRDNQEEKVTPTPPFREEKVTSRARKGDTDVTLTYNDPLNNNYDPHPLESAFHQLTGFEPPHHTTFEYKKNWIKPLDAILKRADGSVAEAIQLMERAVGIHRGKNDNGQYYTIKSPKSILTAALNLPPASVDKANDAWELVRSAARQNDPSMIPDHLRGAVQRVGWDKLTSITPGNAEHYQRRFMEAMT